jgi:hypothetical protein
MATQEVGVGGGPGTQTRAGFEQRVVKALAGLTQYPPTAGSLVLNGKSMTQLEVVKTLQDLLQLFRDLRAMRTQAQAQLKMLRGELVPGHAFYLALQHAVRASFGEGNPVLAQYGYSLGNRKPRSGATSVRAQVKSRLTRALRHTMGPRQKAHIRSMAPQAVTIGPDGTVLPLASPAEANGTSAPSNSPAAADST